MNYSNKVCNKKRHIQDLDINNKTKRNKHNKYNKYNKQNNDNDDDDLILFLNNFKLPQPNKSKSLNSKKTDNKNICNNPICNHKTAEEDPTVIIPVQMDEIKHISDLITLGKSYHCKKNKIFCGMDLRIMCNLVSPLSELHNMVGMDNVKINMVDQILFFLQGLNLSSKCGVCVECVYNQPCTKSNSEMLHTVITGPPGVGKTELGKILGRVYKELGILSTGTFKLVTRADLIAGYLGQTAIKTQKVINEAAGGVLFIDEAYSLGNSELRDSFSKECIDTLNQNLSERRDFLCIIAGYKDALEKCFFNYNDGLRRRFTFKYDIKVYKPYELLEIFEKKIVRFGWNACWLPSNNIYKKLDNVSDQQIVYDDEKMICENEDVDVEIQKTKMRNKIKELFVENIKYLPNYGGDVETLLLNCKICYSRRCTMKTNEITKCLSVEDVTNGFKSFIIHRKIETETKKKEVGMYS
jgi:hypothetical protein